MADYDVEVELVDGHVLTVRVEDGSIDGGYVAATVGDQIVKRAKARLVSPACPHCWNSGIERVGFRFGPNEPERRLICRCPYGAELLAACGPDGYTEDPTKAADGEVGS